MRGPSLQFVVVVLSLFLVAATTEPRRETIEGTAAQVGTNLISISDAHFYRALVKLREGSPNILQREGAEILRKAAQRIAFEHMVEMEVKSLQVDIPLGREVDEELRRLRNLAGKSWQPLLKQYARTGDEARNYVRRILLVERFLQKKLDTLTPIVTEAEVEKYFLENQNRFANQKLAAIKPSLVVIMKKERMQKGLEEWIRFLKGKYGLTLYLEG